MIRALEQHQYPAFAGQQTDLLWEHLPNPTPLHYEEFHYSPAESIKDIGLNYG